MTFLHLNPVPVIRSAIDILAEIEYTSTNLFDKESDSRININIVYAFLNIELHSFKIHKNSIGGGILLKRIRPNAEPAPAGGFLHGLCAPQGMT